MQPSDVAVKVGRVVPDIAPVSVLHIHASSALGGSEHQMLTLASHLDPTRFRVIAACPPGGPLVSGLQDVGIPVHLIPFRDGLDVESIRSLVKLIQDERVGIVHAHVSPSNTLGLLAALIAQVPIRLYTKHSLRPAYLFYDGRLRRFLGRHLECRFLSVGMNAVIAVSSAVRQALIDHEGVPPEKIFTIHNGIDPRLYAQPYLRNDVRRLLGFSLDAPIVLCVARLSPEKGQHYLLHAFLQLQSSHPEARLLLAGDGPDRDRLLRASYELGVQDKAQFLGTSDEVPLLLAAADVVVLPSLFEGFGLSVVEAMFAGKPVVSTNTGGLKEIVRQDVTGLLVPPADASALAAAIDQLLSNPAKAEAIGRAGRMDAEERFTAQRMVEETEEVYGKLLGQRGTLKQAP